MRRSSRPAPLDPARLGVRPGYRASRRRCRRPGPAPATGRVRHDPLGQRLRARPVEDPQHAVDVHARRADAGGAVHLRQGQGATIRFREADGRIRPRTSRSGRVDAEAQEPRAPAPPYGRARPGAARAPPRMGCDEPLQGAASKCPLGLGSASVRRQRVPRRTPRISLYETAHFLILKRSGLRSAPAGPPVVHRPPMISGADDWETARSCHVPGAKPCLSPTNRTSATVCSRR